MSDLEPGQVWRVDGRGSEGGLYRIVSAFGIWVEHESINSGAIFSDHVRDFRANHTLVEREATKLGEAA